MAQKNTADLSLADRRPKAVSAADIDGIIRTLARLRERHPLVHCMTNEVVKDITANVLLATGAAPAMVEHPVEAAQFAAIADALLINLGTLSQTQMQAMRRAIPAAVRAGKPWILDPVAVGALTVRTHFAREILKWHPALIRGNASEIIGLAGFAGKGRGVDSGDNAEAALEAATRLAKRTKGIVLITGPVDYIVGEKAGEKHTLTCANGHPLLTRVTGVGCAQGALAAACVAVAENAVDGALAAAVIMALAGELAAKRARSPGRFRVALLDALDQLDAASIRKHAKIAVSNRDFQIGN